MPTVISQLGFACYQSFFIFYSPSFSSQKHHDNVVVVYSQYHLNQKITLDRDLDPDEK